MRNVTMYQKSKYSMVVWGVLWCCLVALVVLSGCQGNHSDDVTCMGQTATIVGTVGDDDLQGTDGDDVIAGLDGDDRIDGRDGNDLICGGAGDDVIDGGPGVDTLDGDEGANTCFEGEQTVHCDSAPVVPVPVLVLVPDVVGFVEAEAIVTLEAAGLMAGTITQQHSAIVPAGQVVSQEPLAGVEVVEDTAVDLALSLGPIPVLVPDVVGLARPDAEVAITAAGLTLGTVMAARSTTVPADHVISQSPAAGREIVPGSAVDLEVSLGPPDTTPPLIAITEPAGGTLVHRRFVTVSGHIDDEAVTVVVNGVEAIVSDGSFIAADVRLEEGLNTLIATATDFVGNVSEDRIDVILDATPPRVIMTAPADHSLVNTTRITVSGTVDDTDAIVAVNGVEVTLAPGDPARFTAEVDLHEGTNLITAAAADLAGNVATATLRAARDTTPPTVIIEAPQDGAVLTSRQVDIAGLINDMRTGTTINADDVTVWVNGVEADVANRSFLVPGLLLTRGMNTISVQAEDRAGNQSRASIQVTVRDQAGQRVVQVSGSNQSGVMGTQLPAPLVVALLDSQGDPVPGRPVTFAVSRGDGHVSALPDAGASVSVVTDEHGLASAQFSLGQRAGAGNHRVKASAAGFIGQAEFCAIATTAPPQGIAMVAGDHQRGVAGEPLPQPFVALVTDAGGNPVHGVDVTFTVTQGDGHFDGHTSLTRTTSTDGEVSAIFTLGSQEGINNNTVTAAFDGLNAAPATFTATGRVAGEAAETTVSGIVLDNQNMPVPGVAVHLEAPGRELDPVPTSAADDQGQFTIPDAPVGAIRLVVDGSTTTRPGTWPVLEFDLATVSGRDNTVGMPIHLLPLDTDNRRVIPNGGPAADVTLQMAGLPGAEVTIFANSVTCPEGQTECELTWTQVNMEKAPMPPPMGSSFMLAWTMQPPGVHLDPPARICIPNMDMPPGHQVEIFSFDHDLGDFIAVGLATVTEDGAQLCSDPGFGIVKAGWGGCSPPPPPKTCMDGCDDGDICNGEERCKRGRCVAGQKPHPSTPLPADRQDDNDCKVLLCRGFDANDSETPDIEDQPGDCKMPTCRFGRPHEVFTASEMPSQEAGIQDPQCKKCTDNGVEPDESMKDQACDQSGNPKRACYTCQNGACKVPDCKPSQFEDKVNLSFGPLSEHLDVLQKRINDGLKRLVKGKPIGASANFKPVSGGRTKAFTCCPDCTQPPPPDDRGYEKNELN